VANELNDTIGAVSAAISGPGTPDSLKIVQREDRLSLWIRNLAGPAISTLLVGAVVVLTWGLKWGLWTAATERERAGAVGIVAISLALMLGVTLWTVVAGRPARLEVKAGPGSLVIDNSEGGHDH